MKRTVTIFLLLTLLCGCAAPKPEDIAEDVRNTVSGAGQISMVADILADYGSRAYQFRLRLNSQENGWRIEVIEPENIKGLTATFNTGSSTLEYDGVILDVGDLDISGLSPMNCLPTIIDAWLNGHVEEAIRYEDNGVQLVSISYIISDSTAVTTVFEENKFLPAKAEISVDGYTVISCTFGDVVFG